MHYILINKYINMIKNLGYKIEDYPEAWNKYYNEITLPVYFDLNDEQVDVVINAVKKSVKLIVG